jgi:hypothetical protein
MIVDYNKFNVILYFLTGTLVTLSMKQWIYGIMILCLSVCIMIHYNVVTSSNKSIRMYDTYTIIPSIVTIFTLLLASIFILSESTAQGIQKLASVLFMIGTFGFSICKYFLKDHSFFQHGFIEYVSGLLFMVVLLTVSIIPENQSILEKKYNELKEKLE